MQATSRVKACARCRRQKLRCDLYQHPGQSCSRCKRLRVGCSITLESAHPTHNSKKQVRRNPQVALEDSSASPGQNARAVSSHTPSHTSVEQSSEDGSSSTTQHGQASTLSRLMGHENVDIEQVKECFSRFFNYYSKFIHGVFTTNTQDPEFCYKESPFLFWAIVATGSRHLGHATTLYSLAAEEIRNGAFQPLSDITNPIPTIQGSLILCLWPLPVDTMWKDPSHVFAGAAHSLAVQNGLFVEGHEQDFARSRSSLCQEDLNIRRNLWLNCCLIFQATSLCDGLPHFSASGPKALQKDRDLRCVLEDSFRYRVKCHRVLTAAMAAFAEIIGDDGYGGDSLLSMIKIFNDQTEAVMLPPNEDICYLTQCCTLLAISSYHFFIRQHDSKTAGLIRTFSIATEVLDVVSRLDALQDFALYASNYYIRMTLLAAFCILRLIRSKLREQINWRDAEQSLVKAIAFAKRRSMQHGDLDERYSTIISQLWSNSGKMDVHGMNGLDLRIRSRLFMSVVFDSLWWWRVEYNGQGSPYDVDKTAPESTWTEGADLGPAWTGLPVPESEGFESFGYPEVYMDWNFPLNMDSLT